MPTIITRGAASARGYGFSQTTSGAGSLQTVTFTSSGTWVAPAGVTNLVAVIGQGGASSGDYIGGASACSASVTNAGSGSGPNTLPISDSAVANQPNIVAGFLNTGYTGSVLSTNTRTFVFYPNNTFSFSDSGGGPYPLIPVNGTWSVSGSASSSSLGYGDSAYYVAVGQAYLPGSAGGTTTAFGYSFPGAAQVGSYPNATGQLASSVTYTNVAVTPSNSYSISVASGGSVVIQYYA